MHNDTYVFFICLIVFILLVVFSTICITCIYKLSVRLIKLGGDDKRIYKEYEARSKWYSKATRILGIAIDRVISIALLFVFIVCFAASVYVGYNEDKVIGEIPVYRVVKTDSMATVHEKNAYLNELGIDDRIEPFDLILTYQLPAVEDIELYDVIVYEIDDTLVVHRVIGIDPPSASHPNEYYFRFQGDAVASPDSLPVRYSQMRAIYKGERIPFVGSFVLFMQSPAGWLCIALCVGVAIIAPIVDRQIEKERRRRLPRIQQNPYTR